MNMITRSCTTEQPSDWKSQLRDAYRDAKQLLNALSIDADTVNLSHTATELFPFLVTRAYAQRMRPGDPHDPLLRQVLPITNETMIRDGYVDDPVGEHSLLGNSSLIQKYHGRGLLMVTAACAINCRYCFRRAFPYSEIIGGKRLKQAIRLIAEDTSLTEIILSGGDPLIIDDEQLAAIFGELNAIPHIKRIRIHTRLPIVLPDRINNALLDILASSDRSTVIVVHVNHPHELDGNTKDALRRSRAAGVTLLNQSVLLRGINDNADVLSTLSNELFSAGVMPYYINLLDRVSGTAHFEVNEEKASSLEQALIARLPGYLLPKFVREIPGAPAKLALRNTKESSISYGGAGFSDNWF